MRSLWRAHYEIYSGDEQGSAEFTVQEQSVFIRFLDSLFSGIPVIGWFAGYPFNPTYIVTNSTGNEVMRLKKQPALWEGKFAIETVAELNPQQQTRILAALLMMILLESKRG